MGRKFQVTAIFLALVFEIALGSGHNLTNPSSRFRSSRILKKGAESEAYKAILRRFQTPLSIAQPYRLDPLLHPPPPPLPKVPPPPTAPSLFWGIEAPAAETKKSDEDDTTGTQKSNSDSSGTSGNADTRFAQRGAPWMDVPKL
ncbi:hypothetical protein AAMO2058_000513000 [Amorphochlora amoebiformis]